MIWVNGLLQNDLTHTGVPSLCRVAEIPYWAHSPESVADTPE